VTSFDRLHPALQHHIVNSLGWPSLRPLQESAIEPLLAGTCVGPRRVIALAAPAAKAADVTLDFVGTLGNAATVISRLHGGEKRLVFCDSRSRVEELASDLRRRGVDTYVSHILVDQ